jgi:hypothetical protein
MQTQENDMGASPQHENEKTADWVKESYPASGRAVLATEMHDTGLLYLVNTAVLHPHGLALGVEVDEGRVTGLTLHESSDPDGIWFDEDTTVKGRRKLAAAELLRPRRSLTVPAERAVSPIGHLSPEATFVSSLARLVWRKGGFEKARIAVVKDDEVICLAVGLSTDSLARFHGGPTLDFRIAEFGDPEAVAAKVDEFYETWSTTLVSDKSPIEEDLWELTVGEHEALRYAAPETPLGRRFAKADKVIAPDGTVIKNRNGEIG